MSCIKSLANFLVICTEFASLFWSFTKKLGLWQPNNQKKKETTKLV